MANHYFLKVKDVVHQTADAVTIYFWHPVNEIVRYQPGQYLTFLLTVDGQKVRRSYSMSSSPHIDISLAVTIKRLPGGVVSNLLYDTVKPGDVFETIEPHGTFVPRLDPQNRRKLVLIGAGSGITPLMSIIKSTLHVEPKTTIYLLYGNRNTESIIFKEELIALERQSGGRLIVTHILSQPEASWTGLQGRLNQSNLLKLMEKLPALERLQAEYFICGPEGLMDEARRAIHLLGVPTEQVHKENFAASLPAGDPAAVYSHEIHNQTIEFPSVGTVAVMEPEDDLSLSSEVTILYEGSEYKFAVEPHQTILEAALELDIDLPYSCQAGMCTACMGKCTSGKVSLDEEDGLSESERKAGYVLTCVAHPLTKDVVIEIE